MEKAEKIGCLNVTKTHDNGIYDGPGGSQSSFNFSQSSFNFSQSSFNFHSPVLVLFTVQF